MKVLGYGDAGAEVTDGHGVFLSLIPAPSAITMEGKGRDSSVSHSRNDRIFFFFDTRNGICYSTQDQLQ